MTVVCRTPWKVCFTSRAQATSDAKRARAGHHLSKNGQLRPYFCEACDAWHLTSMGKNAQKAAKRRTA